MVSSILGTVAALTGAVTISAAAFAGTSTPAAPTPHVSSAVPPHTAPVRSAVHGVAQPPSAASQPEPRVGYVWPTGSEAEVVREFDPPARRWESGHRGVDLAHGVGEPVRAPAEGVVTFAGLVVDRHVVSIDHADGIRTTYEPLSPTVVPGQRVVAGDVIGTLEAGHCPPWELECLHWGARRGTDDYLDPLELVGVVVRLLQ